MKLCETTTKKLEYDTCNRGRLIKKMAQQQTENVQNVKQNIEFKLFV